MGKVEAPTTPSNETFRRCHGRSGRGCCLTLVLEISSQVVLIQQKGAGRAISRGRASCLPFLYAHTAPLKERVVQRANDRQGRISIWTMCIGWKGNRETDILSQNGQTSSRDSTNWHHSHSKGGLQNGCPRAHQRARIPKYAALSFRSRAEWDVRPSPPPLMAPIMALSIWTTIDSLPGLVLDQHDANPQHFSPY